MTGEARLNRWRSDSSRAIWEKQVETIGVIQRGVFDVAMLAMKSLLIFNGGAIIALLTFFGNFIARNPERSSSIAALADSILLYIVGVALALFSIMLTYLTLEIILRGRVRKLLVEKRPMTVFGSWSGHALRVLAAVSGLASFCLFVAGSITAADALVVLAQ